MTVLVGSWTPARYVGEHTSEAGQRLDRRRRGANEERQRLGGGT